MLWSRPMCRQRWGRIRGNRSDRKRVWPSSRLLACRSHAAWKSARRRFRTGAAFEEDAMKSWGVLPSDNTVWWVLLWIVMMAFFAGVAWFIMAVIDYSVVLPARTE